ncbi:MAG: replicative DNA helicase [Bryobacteraceae bacterium]
MSDCGLTEATLPDDLETERTVLGAAMTDDPSIFLQISGLLQAEDFSLEKHKRIFLCIADVIDAGGIPNPHSLALEFRKRGKLESVDGLTYLVSLRDVPQLVNLDWFCERVKDLSLRRKLISTCRLVTDRCFLATYDRADLNADLERMTQIANASTGRKRSARTVEEVIADEGGINAFLSPEKKPGIHIPFADLNHTLGGLRRSKFVILGARPGVGKTALATQIAEHAAANGNNILAVTLEMRAADVLRRSIAGRAEVSAYKFRIGELSKVERFAIQRETGELASLEGHLRIEDGGDITVQGIEALLRSLRARGSEIDLCIIDYLQLLHSVGRFENRVQEVSTICRGLKRITQRFDIPVLALSQLTRQEDHKRNEQPELHWLKESGQLEQDADQVVFLWLKKDPQEGESTREVFWRVAKNRDGALNRGTLNFFVKFCRFEESRDEGQAELLTTGVGAQAFAG